MCLMGVELASQEWKEVEKIDTLKRSVSVCHGAMIIMPTVRLWAVTIKDNLEARIDTRQKKLFRTVRSSIFKSQDSCGLVF